MSWTSAAYPPSSSTVDSARAFQRISVRGGSDAISPTFVGPYAAIASGAFGARSRTAAMNARGSSRWWIMKNETTASGFCQLCGIVSTWPCQTSKPSARESSTAGSATSSPTALKPSLRSACRKKPSPQPTSRTVAPGLSSAFSQLMTSAKAGVQNHSSGASSSSRITRRCCTRLRKSVMPLYSMPPR